MQLFQCEQRINGVSTKAADYHRLLKVPWPPCKQERRWHTAQETCSIIGGVLTPNGSDKAFCVTPDVPCQRSAAVCTVAVASSVGLHVAGEVQPKQGAGLQSTCQVQASQVTMHGSGASAHAHNLYCSCGVKLEPSESANALSFVSSAEATSIRAWHHVRMASATGTCAELCVMIILKNGAGQNMCPKLQMRGSCMLLGNYTSPRH